MKYLLFSILSLLLTLALSAQNLGTISGKVVNDKNEPLVGASVAVKGMAGGITTDVEGLFRLKLQPGKKYIVTVSSVGYISKEISEVSVGTDAVQEISIVLSPAESELSTVVVRASARRETDNAILSLQKNNATISDGISAESIKRSPDRNTGEVLKRVSGTSIQDNKFVVVRGLVDRYNIATINGAMLPSSEPDRRAFSFDIIPSSLIDNIIIYKTANPDLPGDFAGGVVQVSTKDVPAKNFLSLGAGLSYNSISTGKDFNSGYVGKNDYLGFDDGSRKLPDAFPSRKGFQGLSFNNRAQYSQLLKNTYGDRYNGNALPGQSYQLTWGQRFALKNNAVLGSILGLTYRNSQSLVDGIRSEYDNQFSEVNGAAYTYNDSTYKFSTNIGALLNLSYKKGSSKISFKNLFNRTFENFNLIRNGTQYYSGYASVFAQGAETIVKTLYSTQLEGDHSFGNKRKLSWNVNYALTMRDNPDYRFAPFIKDSANANKSDVPYEIVLRDTYRFFANLEEHAFGGNVNYSMPFKLFGDQGSTLKVGALSQYKTRDFGARIFRFNKSPNSFNENILTLPVRYIFSRQNMNSSGLALEEITNNTDSYDASTLLNAGYVMFDNKLADLWRLVWGLRVESFGFEVNTADFSGSKVKAKKDYLDFLPSVNLTYKLTPKTNLRFSASRTVSRPEFREIANFSFYDFVRNVQVRGNTKLERSQNTNVDLRYETYPSSGEIISVSVFAKHFNKPIELRVDPGSNPLNLIFEYYNAKYAFNYGVEAELRKRLSFISDAPWLDNFYVFANAAYIHSTVNVDGLDVAVADKDRPMQGQSPYLLNAGLTYANEDKGFTANLLVNRIGHRVEAVGNDAKGLPDIYENGRTIIDLQIGKKLLREKAEIRLTVSDLLNQRQVFYQNYRIDTDEISKRRYEADKDRVWASARFGMNLGLSFSYTF